MSSIIKLFLLAIIACCCDSYKILGISYIPRGSHNILSTRLYTEIAKRGHQVTFVSPFPLKTPVENLKVIPVESLKDVVKGLSHLVTVQSTPFGKAQAIMDTQYRLTEHLIKSPEMQKLLHSGEKFDAVIIYQYQNDAVLAIAKHFGAPLILFSSMPLYVTESFTLSHPAPSSYVPNILTGHTGHMDFWQRFKNSFYDMTLIFYYQWFMLPKHRELALTHVPGKHDIYDFLNNASLLLINSHVSTTEPLPLVPNAVEIGGYHIEDPKPLPKDLQKFLDESPNGVVLFSMGSISRSADFPPEKRAHLIEAFSKLKENVLWKFEDESLPGLPPNVKIMKWIPQSDLLAHPNLKVFITHGGLLSTMESVYHAVPVVGIPVFGDQRMNLALAVSYEYALEVPYQELTEENLSKALNEILTNPKYKRNIEKRSKIMRDRPLKPIDTALYWIEYVIRHQGAPHLRYPGADLNWFQRNLLDVVAVAIIMISVPLLAIVVVVKKLLKKDVKRKKE